MKTQVTIDVDVPQDWIDFCTKHSDLFRSDHCGYWAHGARHDARGWLVYVGEDGEEPSREQSARAEELWNIGASVGVSLADRMPNGFYVLDQDAAVKAYAEGVKRWGENWYQNADANKYDVVIQLALLGEVVYG